MAPETKATDRSVAKDDKSSDSTSDAVELSQRTWGSVDEMRSAIEKTGSAQAKPSAVNPEFEFGDLYKTTIDIGNAKSEPVTDVAGRAVVSEELVVDSPIKSVSPETALADGTPTVAGETPAKATTEKSPQELLFDPRVAPEEKVKLARDLAKEGQTRVTGPDGKQYELRVQGGGGRDMIAIFATEGRGSKVMLRGVVNADGSVSKQVGRDRKAVDYVGDWAKQNLPGNALVKHEENIPESPPEPSAKVQPPDSPADEVRPSRSPDGEVRPPSDSQHTPEEQVKPPPASREQPREGEVKQPSAPGDQPGEGEVKPPSAPADKPSEEVNPSPQVEVHQADSELDYIRANFKNLDGDNDRRVTGKEVDDYLAAKKDNLSEAEQAALTRFRGNIDKVEYLNDDGPGAGATLNDIKVAEQRMKSMEFADRHFDAIDSNADGFLTQDELARFGDKNKDYLSKNDRAALEYLKPNISKFEEYSNDEFGDENDGITRADITEARRSDGTNGFWTKSTGDVDQLPLPPGYTSPAEEENIPSTGDQKPDTQEAPPSSSVSKLSEEKRPSEEALPVSTSRSDSELDFVRRSFRRLDGDNNDHITGREVEDYISANKDNLTEVERTALTKFKDNIAKIEERHDDELGDENDGATRNDINAAEQRMNAMEFAEKHFGELDIDSDGFVTQDEIATFGNESSDRLSKVDLTNLKFLRENIHELEEFSNDELGDENDGFTRTDLVEARKSDGTDVFRTRKTDDVDHLRRPEQANKPASIDPGRIQTAEFGEHATKMFDDLDSDKDGFLSKSELSDAVMNSKYTGKDAQAVAALYRAQDRLEELSNDEFGDENDGITRADLQAFEKLEKEGAQHSAASYRASSWLSEKDNTIFKQLDSDGDSFLALDEINAALHSENLGDTDRKNLEFLRDNYSVLMGAHDDEWGIENNGIHLKDLDSYVGEETFAEVSAGLIRTNLAQIGGSNELYAEAGDPLRSITPDAISQGIIGDCYFEASVASMAATQPELIQQMIKDNHDGTYTVSFPGDPENPITVDAPTEAERGLYNGGRRYGVWANVLEKAYGKYVQENPSHRSIMNLGGGSTLSEGADGGELFHGRAMSLLTGKGRNNDSLTFTSQDTVRERLNDALNGDKPRPVIAGISNGISDETSDGFAVAHMYSVTKFDPSGADGGTVTIRNPWGRGENSTSGTKQISLKQFMANFSSVVYADK